MFLNLKRRMLFPYITSLLNFLEKVDKNTGSNPTMTFLNPSLSRTNTVRWPFWLSVKLGLAVLHFHSFTISRVRPNQPTEYKLTLPLPPTCCAIVPWSHQRHKRDIRFIKSMWSAFSDLYLAPKWSFVNGYSSIRTRLLILPGGRVSITNKGGLLLLKLIGI